MPPTLILIRHAQALHNVSSDWSLADPPLSELGERQCAELQESLRKEKLANEVDLIVASAMRRTLQTATLALDWLIKGEGNKGKIRVVADAGWQENSTQPCDTGSSISTMKSEFPTVDFDHVDPVYPNKENNIYSFTRHAILARGQACLKALYHRPEKVIAVVSHSGFLRAAVSNRRYENADWRVFDFDEERMRKEAGEGVEGGENEPKGYWLKEWPLTEERGGGMGRSEKGFFGPVEADFPIEMKDEKAEEVGEVVEEVPKPKESA